MRSSFLFLRKASSKGASLVEYGIVVGLVSVVAIGSVFAVGTNVRDGFKDASSQLASANIMAVNGGVMPVPPEPLGPPESCLDPEMVGQVGKSNWTGGCSGQLIVNEGMLRTAVADQSFAIAGPARSYPIGGSTRAIFTGQVEDMADLFHGVDFNQDIGWWNTSNVVSMGSMFNGSTFNMPLAQWDVSQVQVMSGMFANSAFNQPLNGWNVSNVQRMDWMFAERAAFNQPIGDWDVSNVRIMNHLFTRNHTYNQPVPAWDVSNVQDLMGVFYDTAMNQDLRGWCVPQFPEEPWLFISGSTPMQPENMPIWGTCPARD